MSYIDIHQHLLPGVDDGAKDLAESCRMIKASANDGVSHVFATSHAMPGRKPFNMRLYYDALRAARAWARSNDLPIQIHSGCEILYSEAAVRHLDREEIPTLAGTRFVLVEFMPDVSFAQLMKAGRQINNADYTPIFAHIERYDCLKRASQVEELKSLPDVRLQINAHTLLRRNGFFRQRFLDSLFRSELVDFIATDSHNTTSRSTCMRECYAVLAEKYGEEYADLLTGGNQEEILDDIPR